MAADLGLGGIRNWIERQTARPLGVYVFVLGMMMTLGFAPFNLWPLGVLSLAGLWWLVKRAESRKQAAGATLVWALGHGLTALYWLPWAFYRDSDGSWLEAVAGGVPAVLGLALYGALSYVLVSVAAWMVGRKSGWTWGAAAWVMMLILMEFIKGLHPMGFPWLPVGAMFANHLYMVQAASVGGVWLLSLLGLTMAVWAASGRKWALVAVAGLTLAMFTGGWWRVNHYVAPLEEPTRIRVVQPNITSIGKWQPQERWEILQDTLTTAFAKEDPSSTLPRTVILPETAVAFYLNEEEDVRRALAARVSASIPADGGLVTGTIRRDLDSKTGQTRFYNSLVVMDTQGVFHGLYDKRFLVPFGEYIPGRSWIEALPLPVTLRTFSQSRIDFTHGNQSPLLNTPAGYAVGLICYEGIFPLQVGRAAVEARYLVNISNDGWFMGTIALYQHAALTRLRAVETGLPMVRVTNTGLTLVYDGLGREILRLPINVATHGDVDLPAPLPETPFLRLVQRLSPL